MTKPVFGCASLAGALWQNTRALNLIEARLIHDTGGTWVRYFCLWHLLEPSRGQYDPKAVASIINAVSSAEAFGLKIVVCVSGPAPIWAQAPGDLHSNGSPPANAADYGNILRALAAYFGSRVAAWELWNEPNIPKYLFPVNVTKYVSMLKAGFNAVKQVSPESLVLSGGLSSDRSGIVDAVFIDQMYQQGAGGYLDGVCLHPYTFPYSVLSDPYARANVVPHTNQVMAAHGDGAKKIWITEYGQPTGKSLLAVSETKQSDILIEYLTVGSTLPYLGPLFLFTTRDFATDPLDVDGNMGIFRYNWSPKPVVARLKGL